MAKKEKKEKEQVIEDSGVCPVCGGTGKLNYDECAPCPICSKK